MYHPGPRPVPKLRKFQSGLKHSVTSGGTQLASGSAGI